MHRDITLFAMQNSSKLKYLKLEGKKRKNGKKL